jgi:hypothetical protein
VTESSIRCSARIESSWSGLTTGNATSQGVVESIFGLACSMTSPPDVFVSLEILMRGFDVVCFVVSFGGVGLAGICATAIVLAPSNASAVSVAIRRTVPGPDIHPPKCGKKLSFSSTSTIGSSALRRSQKETSVL